MEKMEKPEKCVFECDFERLILREIENRKIGQKSIAQTYAILIRKSLGGKIVDWPRINKEILKRYLLSGLTRIKELAWKDFEQKPA